jgi:hypothetical protein
MEKTLRMENPFEWQGHMDDLEAEIDQFDAVDLDLDQLDMYGCFSRRSPYSGGSTEPALGE